MERQKIQQRPSKEKLDSLVYDYIVEQIKSGVLLERQHLTESAIARTLGISRTPVRKAFRDLTAAGYLENIANVGVRVKRKPLDAKGFQERSEFLEKLLSYYLFTLENKEIQFENQSLEKIIQKMQLELPLKNSDFEKSCVQYFTALITYIENDYMKTAILKSIREIFLCESRTAMILQNSRRMIYEHLIALSDYLAENDYRYARREIRILFNQMKLDVIEKS